MLSRIGHQPINVVQSDSNGVKGATRLENNTWSVYRHTFPDGKVYIGVTSMDPKMRWANGDGYRNQTKMQAAIEKYGWDNIEHTVLFNGLSENEAKKKERLLIEESDAKGGSGNYNTQFAYHKQRDKYDRIVAETPEMWGRMLPELPDAFYDRFEGKYGVASPFSVVVMNDHLDMHIIKKVDGGMLVLKMSVAYPEDGMSLRDVIEWFTRFDCDAKVTECNFITDEQIGKVVASFIEMER